MTGKNFSLVILFVLLKTISFSQGTWIQKSSNPFTGGVAAAVAFSIADMGYVTTGASGAVNTNALWQYDTTANTWSQKASLPGSARDRAIGFSIGNKGYVGTGLNLGTPLQDFWEYDVQTNSWTQKANFAGGACYEATGFSSTLKGYVVNGNDVWEYDPINDQWNLKAPFPGASRTRAIAFVVNGKAYYGMGTVASPYLDELWEYDIANDWWLQRTTIPSSPNSQRDFAVAFSIGSYGYVGTGRSLTGTKDFWQYNPANDSWLQMADLPALQRFGSVGFSIGNKGYLGYGSVFNWAANDLYEFTPPDISTGISSTNANAPLIIVANPFNSVIEIIINPSQKIYNGRLVLYNVEGKRERVIENINANKIMIERQGLGGGIHFFELYSEGEIFASGKIF